MRLLISLCFLLPLVCTCGRADENPNWVIANLRYDQVQELLSADVTFRMAEGNELSDVPKLFGLRMDARNSSDNTSFRFQQNMIYPALLPFSVPCGDDFCELDVSFAPVFSDSLPSEIDKSKTLRVAIGNQALTEEENVIFFFEPKDRSAPKSVKILGPTKEASASLRSGALAEIPAGDYDVYLIKQGLQKDSTQTLKSTIQLEYITRTRPVTVVE